MEHSRTRVGIIGPKSLPVDDMHALRKAFRGLGARAVAYRTDVDFTFEKFNRELGRATHLLIVLDRLNGYTDTILSYADKTNVSVSFLCLYTDEILSQFSCRINQGKVDVVIVRSYFAHTRIGTRCRHSLVAENIAASAPVIARTVVSMPMRLRTVTSN